MHPRDAKTLNRVIGRVKDKLPFGAAPREPLPEPFIETHFVRITSTTQTAGRYPGTRYDYDANADSYTAGDTIWVDTPNGESLSTGTNYVAKLVGVKSSDGVAIYQVVTGVQSSFSGAGIYSLDSNHSLTDGVATFLSWSSPGYDTDSYYSGAQPTRLTVPTTGYYLVTCSVLWQNAGVANFWKSIKLYFSGALVNTAQGGWQGDNGFSAHEGMSFSYVRKVSSLTNPYFQVVTQQNSGGTYNPAFVAANCSFTVTKLGSA